jgi:ankyrin repeat protein
VKDASGNTMLIVAAQNGHRAVLEALVTLKADLNVTNAKGNSALHYLFAYGFQAEAEMLISKGADDYAQNLEGYTCYEMGLID